MLPSTVQRVNQQTRCEDNWRIQQHILESIQFHSTPEGRKRIDKRLDELDHEWDIERTLEMNSSTAVLLGVGLGTFVNKKFFALSGIVAGFLLQHALQGWCPPLPVFRRLGFRTQSEIEQERYALKLIRGDFEAANGQNLHETENSAMVVHDAVNR